MTKENTELKKRKQAFIHLKEEEEDINLELNLQHEQVLKLLESAEVSLDGYKNAQKTINIPKASLDQAASLNYLNYQYSSVKRLCESIEKLMKAIGPDSAKINGYDDLIKRKKQLDLFVSEYSYNHEVKERKQAPAPTVSTPPSDLDLKQTPKQKMQEELYERAYFGLYSIGSKIDNIKNDLSNLCNSKEIPKEKFLKFFDQYDILEMNLQLLKDHHSPPFELRLGKSGRQLTTEEFLGHIRERAVARWLQSFPHDPLPISTEKDIEDKYFKDLIGEEMFEHLNITFKDDELAEDESEENESDIDEELSVIEEEEEEELEEPMVPEHTNEGEGEPGELMVTEPTTENNEGEWEPGAPMVTEPTTENNEGEEPGAPMVTELTAENNEGEWEPGAPTVTEPTAAAPIDKKKSQQPTYPSYRLEDESEVEQPFEHPSEYPSEYPLLGEQQIDSEDYNSDTESKDYNSNTQEESQSPKNEAKSWKPTFPNFATLFKRPATSNDKSLGKPLLGNLSTARRDTSDGDHPSL